MYFVYILKSQKNGSFYTGTTENIEKRIQEHNWHLSKYTSSKTPFELVWHCTFSNKKQAIDFEKYLKSGSGFAFRNKHLV